MQTETFGTLPQLADALLNKQVDAIILNNSYFSVLKGTEGIKFLQGHQGHLPVLH